jgi:hypothetical protein
VLVQRITTPNQRFVIEAEGTPTAMFQTKWHADAGLICRTWTNNHWQKLLLKGPGRLEFLPLIKLRLARPDEIAAYAAENGKFDIQEGTRRGHADHLSTRAGFAILSK